MIIVRFVGWLLLLAALIVLGRDLLAWYDTGIYAPVSLEQLWSNLDRAGLERVQRMFAPWIWNGIIQEVLRLWAGLSLAVVGILLIWAGRRRDTRRRR
jgi:uncharacterized membrane protein